MPKVTAATVAVTGLLLIALTGCAAEADDAGGESTAPVVSASATPEETAAPLVAETPAGAGAPDVEAAFLASARERLSAIRSQIPNATDEQLLTAGHEACERLAAGESGESMSLIDGEEMTNGYFQDSGAIITAARLSICPID